MVRADLERAVIYSLAVLFVVFRPTVDFELTKTDRKNQMELLQVKNELKNDLKISPMAGVDVSHFQNEVNWHEVKKAGVDFVFIKATDGVSYHDPKLHINAQGAKEVNLPYSTYHFFEPGDDPLEQAKHFIETVKDIKQILRPVIDVETIGKIKSGELQKNVKVWLDYVEEKLGCRPIFYSYSRFWDEHLGEAFLDYPLWLADYAKVIKLPNGAKGWDIWQHSEKGRVEGVKTYIDLNILNGNSIELKKLECN